MIQQVTEEAQNLLKDPSKMADQIMESMKEKAE